MKLFADLKEGDEIYRVNPQKYEVEVEHIWNIKSGENATSFEYINAYGETRDVSVRNSDLTDPAYFDNYRLTLDDCYSRLISILLSDISNTQQKVGQLKDKLIDLKDKRSKNCPREWVNDVKNRFNILSKQYSQYKEDKYKLDFDKIVNYIEYKLTHLTIDDCEFDNKIIIKSSLMEKDISSDLIYESKWRCKLIEYIESLGFRCDIESNCSEYLIKIYMK